MAKHDEFQNHLQAAFIAAMRSTNSYLDALDRQEQCRQHLEQVDEIVNNLRKDASRDAQLVVKLLSELSLTPPLPSPGVG